MMNKSLRILIIEDSEDDTILLTRKLRQSGYEPLYERVDTRKKMEESLKKQSWDLILCDYSMPNFNAVEALKLLQKSGLDIPFIIISGTIGEDIAVEAVKAGASDYMLKDNLIRLLPAIDRELRELKNRRARKLAEEALIKSEQNLQNIISASMDGVVVVDENGIVYFVNPAAEKMFGREKNKLVGSVFGHPAIAGEVIQIDIAKPDGEIVVADMRTVETTWEGKHCFLTILRDFTEQKRLQDALTESEEKLRALVEY
jgi:two-component system cell cycle sensor histidine kinase/response regulator CckA